MKIRERIKRTYIGNLLIAIQYHFRKWQFQKEWRKKNSNNLTEAKSIFNLESVKVGNFTYGDLNIVAFNTNRKLTIGCVCSIGQDVKFILEADHNISNVSTFPYKVGVLNNSKHEAISKGDIVVDDDVWIGYGAIIMSGVHIGQGAVVAAGAVVTKDVPPYAVVGGLPAKVIKYRFSEELIKELIQVDYSKLTREMIVEHELDLYEEFVDKQQLAWMPKKDINT